MLKVLALIASLIVGVATAASDADWMVFKAKHGKVYSREEDYFRRMIFEENLQRIRSHNELFAKGLASFYLGHNKHLDRSNNEFVKAMNGYTITTNQPNSLTYLRNDHVQFFKFNTSSAEPLPSEIDWRKKGYVTPVKDQGQCGSCWAFSTTGSLEGAQFKSTGKLVSLSEQNLMDCSWSYGNEGCNGGLMVKAFKYIVANKGINTEKSYPYTEKDSRDCKFQRENVGATMSKYTVIAKGSETQLQKAVATIGPVSVAIDASNRSFQFYEGGVYNEADCSSTKLDHGVLVVGYGTDNGQDYWLVKNSWGSDWGQDGYIKMSRNTNNQCGIATSASYPIV